MAKRSTSKPGIHGMNTGSQMGGPKFGQMTTPARLAKTRKPVKGGKGLTGKRR